MSLTLRIKPFGASTFTDCKVSGRKLTFLLLFTSKIQEEGENEPKMLQGALLEEVQPLQSYTDELI